jgi:hypothetical protein
LASFSRKTVTFWPPSPVFHNGTGAGACFPNTDRTSPENGGELVCIPWQFPRVLNVSDLRVRITGVNYAHLWIPVIVVDTSAAVAEQQRAEECRLCGTFRNGATPDPPAAALPCPFPPPTLLELSDEEQRQGALIKCCVCGSTNSPGAWDFSGKFCPNCGSHHGATEA